MMNSIFYKLLRVPSMVYRFIFDFFLFNLFYAIFWIISLRSSPTNMIGFSSNHLNGELKYIFDALSAAEGIKLFFVTDLPEEIQRLNDSEIEAYYFRDLFRIPLFINTRVWITSHGPYFIPDYLLFRILKRHRGKWVDTWHGVGVENGSGLARAKMLCSYDMAFVPSEFYREYYSSKQEGIKHKIRVTGSPRTDSLLNGSLDRQEIARSFNLSLDLQNILYAPSWGNPAAGEERTKNIFPFGNDFELIDKLEAFCSKNGYNFIIRTHPNWEDDNKNYANEFNYKIKGSKYIHCFPLKKFPLTEPVLYITDILITDYSSIANDFIVLDRPIIYLDKGLEEDRFIFRLDERGGFLAKSAEDMMDTLATIKEHPRESQKKIEDARERYARTIYKYMDGKASQRCAQEILRLLQ